LGQAHGAVLLGRMATDRALDLKECGDAHEGLLSDRGVAALGVS
jgi:hypothetical protein